MPGEVDGETDQGALAVDQPCIAWGIRIEHTGDSISSCRTDCQADSACSEADEPEAEQARFVVRHVTGNLFGRIQ